MSPATIGLSLGILGPLDAVAQGLFFTKILRRLGLKKLFLTCMLCFVPLFAMAPVINHFARQWGLSPAIWALIVFQCTINCFTEMAFGEHSTWLTEFLQTPLTVLVASLSRLHVPIHLILDAKPPSSRDSPRHRTSLGFARSSSGTSDFNVPLLIHTTATLDGWIWSLRRVHHHALMWSPPPVQTSEASVGIQMMRYPYSALEYALKSKSTVFPTYSVYHH